MKRILLLIEHQQNRLLLSQWLKGQYEVLFPQDEFAIEGKKLLEESFDLCFIDFAAIHQLRQEMLAKREQAIPTFLPFVFITPQQNIGFSTDHLEPLVDDIVHLPINKVELQTKLRVLLRTRSYSLKLQATQEELNQALSEEKELNQLKSRFVSIVSHEFRNPLNSISGTAQILDAYGDKLSSEKKAEVLNQLQRNVAKMTALLDDVLIISRKDLGKLPFNPASLQLELFCHSSIGEIQTIFNYKQQINLVYQAHSTTFNLDHKLLHHILTNLLANACKYSPKNSIINFDVFSQGSEIVFKISDRGIGIPPQDIPKLFDTFYRASNSEGFSGTGLGLAIAKNYVEIHRGTISVESELNVGTTFTVTIPIS